VGFTVTRVPFDAWLDSVGRLRELSQSFTFAAADTGPAASDRADTPPDDAHRDDKNGAALDPADPAKPPATYLRTKPGAPGTTPADKDQGGSDPARTDAAAARSRAAGAAYRARHDVTVVSTTRYDLFGTTVIVIMPRPADIWTGKIVSAQPR
jgi:hypothetical protein